MINVNDYFDSILEDIRNDTGLVTESENDSEVMENVLLNSAISVGTKTAINHIKYPIDANAKKIIVNKIKLEMKIKKFESHSPKNTEEIKKLKDELKEVNKFYNSMHSVVKSDKAKDILDEYEAKCRADYGPRSIFYASIRIPEVIKESKRDALMGTGITDFILENGVGIINSLRDFDKNILLNESNDEGFAGSGMNKIMSAKPTDTMMKTSGVPSNGDVAPNSSPYFPKKGTIDEGGDGNDGTCDKSDPVVDENFIANMLPQTGSTEGLGNPASVVKDVNNLNDSIENKTSDSSNNLEGIELPDDIELESVYNYIMSDDLEYDYTTEGTIRDFAMKIKTKTILSSKIKKAALERTILKNKIKITLKFGKSDKKVIDELKRKLIEKEKELRNLQADLNTDEAKDLKEFINTIEKELKDHKYDETNDKDDKKDDTNKEKNSKKTENDEKNDKDALAKIGRAFAKKEKSKSITESGIDSLLEDIDAMVEANSINLQGDFSEISPEINLIKVYEAKLEKAMTENNIDAVISYNNKLRYIKEHVSDYIQSHTSSDDMTFEAANIDSEMKPIIEVLNKKGYKTKYSSAGHKQLRKKEDDRRDGVYYGKLYSDARVQFDKDYDFPAAPKYWCWKAVEGVKDYLDIIPEPYRESDGTPDEAFSKWKTNYLNTLKTWVDNLPDQNKSNNEGVTADKKGRLQVQESVNDFYNDMLNSFNENYFND